ncbi:unnamed protein product [Caenorhabditis sp. 36 PRJEB53466]|nr:unnamed protein product [Caenorhabditis sp. 36 PRJEB53466]
MKFAILFFLLAAAAISAFAQDTAQKSKRLSNWYGDDGEEIDKEDYLRRYLITKAPPLLYRVKNSVNDAQFGMDKRRNLLVGRYGFRIGKRSLAGIDYNDPEFFNPSK